MRILPGDDDRLFAQDSVGGSVDVSSPPSAEGRPLAGLRVLVVDASRDGRELLRLILGYFGATVMVAQHAEAALTALEQFPADVVLADVPLGPPRGGLVHAARQRGSRAPFVALSRDRWERMGLEASGFAASIAKPIDHAVLVETIVRVIGEARAS